ncbi:MAG: ATP-binding protein [Deltaproteobacteria bacterium]|nr:ATP-binding protein [Deltaproteobacteria bacterium]
MDASRLTLTNRPENLRLLLDFIQKWGKDRSLPQARLDSLEMAAGKIFRHVVDHAYQPGEPGSIAVQLQEKGPRLRLMFEDDAKPPGEAAPNADDPPASPPHLNGLQHLAESLIYYRTADRKNRLVVFLS